jgi:ketosteroid isomerase-like protein
LTEGAREISTDNPAVAIRALLDAYVESVNDGDLELASRVWLNDKRASFIHPRGHEQGWNEVSANFYGLTMGTTFSRRSLRIIGEPLIDVLSSDAVVARFDWRFNAEFRADGSSLETEGRESQVWTATGDGWRLAHVHYSGMPVSAEREGF